MAVIATLKCWSACGKPSTKAIDAGADGRLLACRIELTGRAELHDHLLVSTDYLLAEARAAALGFGDAVAWIERVIVATEKVLDPALLAGREDAMGELYRHDGRSLH